MMNGLKNERLRIIASAPPPPPPPPIRLTSEEENAVRYAAGFVPFRLLKKYETRVYLKMLSPNFFVAYRAWECKMNRQMVITPIPSLSTRLFGFKK